MFGIYFVVCFISFFAINLELFLTRILSLKTWNHVVYIVIPFAILGYGIGANIVFLAKDYLQKVRPEKVLGYSLIKIALYGLVCTMGISYLPVCVDDVAQILVNMSALSVLLWAYTLFAIPFTLIGFLLVYVFTFHSAQSSRIYFFDLLGAGLGAFLFFFLINSLEVTRSLVLLCVLCLLSGVWVLVPKRKTAVLLILLLSAMPFVLKKIPEIKAYTIDKNKGWEWIPGAYKPHQYKTLLSQWHPLGRTDVFQMIDPAARQLLSSTSIGTFEINVVPAPEFAYITTNFLAGAPIYRLSSQGLAEHQSRLQLFSQGMEAPYVLFDRPDVVVIGAGGGRDIFMAKSHGARNVVGAEINPAIVQALSPGGKMYGYSGGVYSLDGTKVYNVDGRHLVKRLEPGSFDLIVLNGVDTFSGLTTGAYAYAESYLYTKNAVMDYLRVIRDNGVINFNRWLFPDQPRETLRLFAIALDALKASGAAKPWDHIIIGDHVTWSLMLIKKTPFSPEERTRVRDYFNKHRIIPIYPGNAWTKINKHPVNYFAQYTADFQKGSVKSWASQYPYDISVVTDDDPFFYKYYKISSFNPFKVSRSHHLGSIMFMTQILVLLQALLFILVFILLPLWVFKRKSVRSMPAAAVGPFIMYFACLGCGFMFIEIPMMQKFVLMLGSPIYSISVILALLLISTGIGSFSLPSVEKMFKSHVKLIRTVTALLIMYVFFMVTAGSFLADRALGMGFAARVAVVGLLVCPLGLLLGVYFPLGLHLIGHKVEEAIPWAWGINSGFSVFASMLAIIIAQFSGFTTILLLAAGIYGVALLSYQRLDAGLK